ncbi:MAG: hypothetical protein LBS84_11175 [Clostridiales bacterium]|jgi:hypothetical protein|nr:hypothetical protein [Clostridiales bacterium]
MILAVSAFIAFIITGTYAWIQLSTQAYISRTGLGGINNGLAGGTLHNDYLENDEINDIYVENWGERLIYARIRLREYMEIGEGVGKDGSENKSRPIVDGSDRDNPETWSIHIPCTDGTPEICELSHSDAFGFHTYWSWEMGGQKYYYPVGDENRSKADPSGATYIDSGSPSNLNAQSPNSPFGKPVSQTLNAGVLTMRQWLDMGRPVGEYWVIDTDGWAYWADAIRPGTATGLLLHSTTLISEMTSDYHYKIYVEPQMTTKINDEGTSVEYTVFEASGWTENGRALMELITGKEASGAISVNSAELSSSMPILGGRIYVRQGSSVDLGIKDTAVTPASISVSPDRIKDVSLTWRPEDGVWNIHIEKSAKIFSSFTLNLTEDAEQGSSASVKIAVLPEKSSGVIIARGGIPILDYGDGSYRPVYETDNGELYGGSWISGSDLSSSGFAIVSTLPIINEVVYLKRGQSFGLTVTGTAPNFERIGGNFPSDSEYYKITEMISLRSCTVTAKEDAPAGTRFIVKISQHTADGSRIAEPRGIQVVVIPEDAEGVVTGKSGKVYVNYGAGSYSELGDEKLGPRITKDGVN